MVRNRGFPLPHLDSDSVKWYSMRYDTAITTGEGLSMHEAVTAGAIASVLRESCHIVIARARSWDRSAVASSSPMR